METKQKIKPIEIHYTIVEELFDACPFCGEKPNVFQVPEKRYGKNNPFGWVIECKSMGCIFRRTSPDQSFKRLMEEWNKRIY